MDYLQTSLLLLEQENKQLKDKLSKMEHLNNIINQQRSQQQKEYLSRLHQQEINVIREMAESQQQYLKKEIKQLKAEIGELTKGLMQEDEVRMTLKRQLQDVNNQLEDIKVENIQLRHHMQEKEQKITSMSKNHETNLEKLQREFKARQKEIIENYMQKIEELTEKHDDELVAKERVIASQNKTVELAKEEKQLLEEQLQRMMSRWQHEEGRRASKGKAHQQELQAQKAQNQKLSMQVKRLEGELFQLKQSLRQETREKKHIESELSGLRKKYGQLELSKKKQVERQKSKVQLIYKDLTDHKKYLKGQMDVSKRKQREYNQSKKQLITKIKQMREVSDKCKTNNTSFVDKTTTKTQKKQTIETYQSVSLDNSFNRDSPSVSCFLKDYKIQSKLKLKKKPLTIDTNNQDTILRFESVDTPCFQSAKQANKKTIKIRK